MSKSMIVVFAKNVHVRSGMHGGSNLCAANSRGLVAGLGKKERKEKGKVGSGVAVAKEVATNLGQIVGDYILAPREVLLKL
jgi:hypothetical protein